VKRVVAALLTISMFTLCVGIALASDNFGELNIKAGFQFVGKMGIEYKNPDPDEENKKVDLNNGVIITGEYVIPLEYFSEIIDSLKFGAGLSYLLPRDVDKKDANISVSCLPIYFILQVNPFIGAQNKVFRAIFVKGNFGYNALFDFENKNLINKYKIEKNEIDKTGGVYYGVSAGYEFHFGLIVDLGYYMCRGNIKINHTEVSVGRSGYFASDDITCSNVTLNLGYKFKI
jgi:hypothetical protein